MANNNGVGGTTSERQAGGVFDNAADANANLGINRGVPGRTGPAGPEGPTGPAGMNGRDGMPGASIAGVTDVRNADNDGSILTITFTDGRAPITVDIPDGAGGMDGRSIVSITATPTSPMPGEDITVTITFNTGPPSTFTVPGGMRGRTGARVGTVTVVRAPVNPGDETVISFTDSDGVPIAGQVTIEAGEEGEAGDSVDGVTATGGANPGDTTTLQFTSGTDNVGGPVTVQPGAGGTQGNSVGRVITAGGGAPGDTTTITFRDTADNPITGSVTIQPGTSGATYVPTSPDDSITVNPTDATMLTVTNPFTDDDETKLDNVALRDTNIVAGPLQSDNSRTYTWTHTATDGTTRTETWTTGGGTGPQPSGESFIMSVNHPRIERGNPDNLVDVSLTVGVTADSVADGFTYTGYQNLRLDGSTITGVDAAGTPATGQNSQGITIPIAALDVSTVGTHRFTVELLSTDPQSAVAPPRQATITVTIFQETQDIYFGYSTNGSRAGVSLDQLTDTSVNGEISPGAESDGFLVGLAPAGQRTLIVAFPTQTGTFISARNGSLTEDGTVAVTDNHDNPVVPYTGLAYDDFTGNIRLFLERSN